MLYSVTARSFSIVED